MVVCLVLRANVGEDYQPKGFNSCWTALSPQGNDALERSLYQMREKIHLCCWKKCSRSCTLAETTGINKTVTTAIRFSTLLSFDHCLPCVASLIKSHNISDPVMNCKELLQITEI